jgi:hypothetical protein
MRSASVVFCQTKRERRGKGLGLGLGLGSASSKTWEERGGKRTQWGCSYFDIQESFDFEIDVGKGANVVGCRAVAVCH